MDMRIFLLIFTICKHDGASGETDLLWKPSKWNTKTQTEARPWFGKSCSPGTYISLHWYLLLENISFDDMFDFIMFT